MTVLEVGEDEGRRGTMGSQVMKTVWFSSRLRLHSPKPLFYLDQKKKKCVVGDDVKS